MTRAAEVFLWGTRIGVVSQENPEAAARFQYADGFARAGVEPSPLTMRVTNAVYQFPELARQSFHGLPGMLADSVPDKFGNALIDAWLVRQGRPPDSFTAIERLCYTGNRGMGALEYRPALASDMDGGERLEVAALVELASRVLTGRRDVRATLTPEKDALATILKVGSSAGGARAKAVVAWNEATGEVRSGQIAAPEGFGYWLLKLDGVSDNGDKEGADASGYGAVEYAYSLMAKAAGIEMTECRLFEEGGRRHFMTRRFDRLADGGKLHAQTLGALAHYDFNLAGAYSYEQALLVARRVVNDARAAEQLFRRAVFHVFAWNCDDHVKNISFLMNRRGTWSLAPAYDVTYAHNPSGAWTGSHQMTVNGKRAGITREDLRQLARAAMLPKAKADSVIDCVRAAVARWPEFADAAHVSPSFTKVIATTLRC